MKSLTASPFSESWPVSVQLVSGRVGSGRFSTLNLNSVLGVRVHWDRLYVVVSLLLSPFWERVHFKSWLLLPSFLSPHHNHLIFSPSLPHHLQGERKIQPNQLFLIIIISKITTKKPSSRGVDGVFQSDVNPECARSLSLSLFLPPLFLSPVSQSSARLGPPCSCMTWNYIFCCACRSTF